MHLLQKVGFVKSSMPTVLEDRETQDKNQARNEEQKRLADEAKAKKAKKAKAAEDLVKRYREAKKAVLLEPESPGASISEGGDSEDPHWLNELLAEESPIQGGRRPPAGGRRYPGAQTAPP